MCSLKGLSLLYFSDKDKCVDLQLQTKKKKHIFIVIFQGDSSGEYFNLYSIRNRIWSFPGVCYYTQ